MINLIFLKCYKKIGDFMYYTERIQWIRDCKNITQKEIADYLGIGT